MKPEFLKRSNIPSFYGDFESLLHSALKNKGTPYDYIDGYKYGRDEGLLNGSEATIKSFITSGENQIFLTKEGKIIPFKSNEDILSNVETSKLIKDFIQSDTKTKIMKKETEYNNFINTFEDGDAEMHMKREEFEITHQLQQLDESIIIGNELNKNIDKINNDKIDKLTKTIEDYNKKINNSPIKEQTKQTRKKYEKIENEIVERKKIKDSITAHFDNRKKLNLKNEIEKMSIEHDKLFKGNKWQTYFTDNYKSGLTSMLITDNFNIYNIDNVRKIFPKTKLLNVFEKNENRNNYEMNETNKKYIQDFSTNPINSNKVNDYIQVPQQKFKYNIEKKVEQKYGFMNPGLQKYIEDVTKL